MPEMVRNSGRFLVPVRACLKHNALEAGPVPPEAQSRVLKLSFRDANRVRRLKRPDLIWPLAQSAAVSNQQGLGIEVPGGRSI
jgi:hypothetical protein